MLSFKVDAQYASRIRAKARAARSSVSAYLRKAALGEDETKRVKIVRRKHPVSGLPYNATVTGAMVGDDEIRAALGEFP